MASSYLMDLERGWKSKSFDLSMNRWAAPFTTHAMALDKMELPEEAVKVLRELFEDIAAFQRAVGDH